MIMFKFFKKETNSILEEINDRLKLNASNNYRDATIDNLKELEAQFIVLQQKGKLNDSQISYYRNKIDSYKEEFKNFTHKAQKAGW